MLLGPVHKNDDEILVRKTLVLTTSSRVQYLPTVSFGTIQGDKFLALQIESMLGQERSKALHSRSVGSVNIYHGDEVDIWAVSNNTKRQHLLRGGSLSLDNFSTPIQDTARVAARARSEFNTRKMPLPTLNAI